MTRIALLTLGGTISSDTAVGRAGVVPTHGATDLADTFDPGAVVVEPHDVLRVASGALSTADLLGVATRIATLVDDGADGVVVSQGTDSLEETAYLLDLVGAAGRVPVVVTGAMRDASAAGADGPANLAAAVIAASSPLAAGAGVLVAFADHVHAARWVTKTSTFAVDAFSSAPLGPVGWVAEGRLHLPLRPVVRPGLAIPTRPVPPVVAVLAGPGDDLAVLDALPHQTAGVVVGGLGAGHVAGAAMDRIRATAARIPVVVGSRVGVPVARATYGYEGSEVDLAAAGCLSAGTLSPSKARVLLAVLRASGLDGTGLAREWDRHA